ncbi:MAG: ammonium transporter [candidate division NC10 bacterium]|nr:ammonium transporter [candidate division NC10 bacterium]
MKSRRNILRLGAAVALLASLALGGTMVLAAEEPAKSVSAEPPAAAAPAPAQTAAAAPAPPKPDPSGAATGGIGDITAKVPGKPTLEEVADAVGHNKISINMMWTLVAGFLVMFMQAGFALAETGLTRAKNAAHTMMMNMMVYALGMTGYWIMGYALQMGGVGAVSALSGGTANLASEFTITLFGKEFGLFGMTGFFLSGVSYDAAIFTLFLFQMVFMDTAATIPTGAMAERWKFSSFVVFAFFISMVTYPLYANWVWGGGWLSTLGKNFGLGHGHVDFAGSSVVHMVGGVTALAGAWVLGPRLGKFNRDGSANALPAHNIPMAITGAFILAFGRFGFNAGSTLAGTDLRIGVVATNTMLASASGAISAMFYMWAKYGKPDPSMAMNGMLAGLVAITAPCAFVNSVSAFIIGAVAGVLVCLSVFFVERTLKIDDPVGAISVHGACGAWGVLSLGLLADGTYGDAFNGVPGTVRGLFYGDAGQFVAQAIGTLTNLVFVFAASWAFFKTYDLVFGMRVAPEIEIERLDIPEMGALAYPDFSLVPSHSGGISSGSQMSTANREPAFGTAKKPQTV